MPGADIWSVLGGPVQVAYAVDDVMAAADRFVALGAGPFFVRHHIPVTAARVRGTATFRYDHSSAYGQWGDVMVELLCEHHAGDERVGPATGVHHMAFFVDDFVSAENSLVDHGWPEALYAEAGAMPFAWHDATHDLGHLVEIYPHTERLAAFYAMVSEASTTWDGADPIRVL